MKKLFTIVCTLVLGGVMSFAQAQNPPAAGTTDAGKTETGKKKHHHHKAGKKAKAKKGAADTGAGAGTPK